MFEKFLGKKKVAPEAKKDAFSEVIETSTEQPSFIDMPDLKKEVESTGFVKIKIHHFSSIKPEGRWYTEPFEACSKKWRILVYPRGVPNTVDGVSIFIDYFSPKDHPKWSVCAQFCLHLFAEDNSLSYSKATHHRFVTEEIDWGFKQFLTPKVFYSEEKGKRFLVNDTLTIGVFIKVMKDPTGVLWRNLSNYDSKAETGRIGMINQGATCYMNSLLQSLYYTSSFKKSVYLIPTDNEENPNTITLALQRVFFFIERSEKPVDTTDLTKSFGWDSRESFMQHDVQEFNRVLCDKLENKMKGTAVEGAINKLFEGKMKSYVRCINVDYESSREEVFYDIQLNVKGMKNLTESFEDYIQVETLEGDNKYFAEGHGLQDAKKGVTFLKFPPVLHLQLKRFEYDVTKDAMVKINDRHEFPDVIDLTRFLENPNQEAQIYRLHGVLVHSGDLHGGHYCAFIKTEKNGEWFKFDDEIVTRALPSEAMEENYGMDPAEKQELEKEVLQTRQQQAKKNTNAYMLVYIREKELDSVLEEVTTETLPESIRNKFENEMKLAEEKKREREEQHLYFTLKITTDQLFSDHHSCDLCSFDTKLPGVPPIVVKMKKQSTFLELKNMISEKTRIPINKQRLWAMSRRQNGTTRPDDILSMNDSEKLDSIKSLNKQSPELKLYVEEADLSSKGEPEFTNYDSNSDILIFIKMYNPSLKTLDYKWKLYCKKTDTPNDIALKINQKCNMNPNNPLLIFEEVRLTIVEKVKMELPFAKQEIGTGDILIFQDNKDSTTDQENLVTSFFEQLVNRVVVKFIPVENSKDESKHHTLELSKKMKHDDVVLELSSKVSHDSKRIQLFQLTPFEGKKKEIKRDDTTTLDKVLSMNNLGNEIKPLEILYYELLDCDISEMEKKKQISFSWISKKITEMGPLKALVNKDGKIENLATAVYDRMKKEIPDLDLKKPLRIFEVYGHKIVKVLKPEDPITIISLYATLFVEQIPEDQLVVDEKDKIIAVSHFNKDQFVFHGLPFYFLIKHGEPLADTLSRMQSKLEIPDKEWSKYKFAILGNSKPKYLAPEEFPVLSEYPFSAFEFLGIDHPDKKSQTLSRDKAIVIRD